jgi:hypothetical protein
MAGGETAASSSSDDGDMTEASSYSARSRARAALAAAWAVTLPVLVSGCGDGSEPDVSTTEADTTIEVTNDYADDSECPHAPEHYVAWYGVGDLAGAWDVDGDGSVEVFRGAEGVVIATGLSGLDAPTPWISVPVDPTDPISSIVTRSRVGAVASGLLSSASDPISELETLRAQGIESGSAIVPEDDASPIVEWRTDGSDRIVEATFTPSPQASDQRETHIRRLEDAPAMPLEPPEESQITPIGDLPAAQVILSAPEIHPACAQELIGLDQFRECVEGVATGPLSEWAVDRDIRGQLYPVECVELLD